MKNRVRIPATKPLEVIALIKRIESKHTADGDASLLKELNWPEVGAIADEALKHHNDAEQKKREASDLYELRAKKIAQVLDVVRDSRDILRRKYKNQVKALGNWGFDVLDPQTTVTAQQQSHTDTSKPI